MGLKFRVRLNSLAKNSLIANEPDSVLIMDFFHSGLSEFRKEMMPMRNDSKGIRIRNLRAKQVPLGGRRGTSKNGVNLLLDGRVMI